MSLKRYNRNQGAQEPKGEKSKAKKVLFSYMYMDRNQGQTFEQWDKKTGRLLRWENLVATINTLTLSQAITNKMIIVYNNLDADISNMPKKSKWKFPPRLVGMEIIWCKIEVMNKVRVIGFLEENIFHVVFLDELHEFYPTEPKNT